MSNFPELQAFVEALRFEPTGLALAGQNVGRHGPGAAARLIRNLFVAASLPEPAEVINESVLSDFKRLRHN